jgi:hypothetical protein
VGGGSGPCAGPTGHHLGVVVIMPAAKNKAELISRKIWLVVWPIALLLPWVGVAQGDQCSLRASRILGVAFVFNVAVTLFGLRLRSPSWRPVTRIFAAYAFGVGGLAILYWGISSADSHACVGWSGWAFSLSGDGLAGLNWGIMAPFLVLFIAAAFAALRELLRNHADTVDEKEGPSADE